MGVRACQLPTAADLAIMAGAVWDSRSARVVRSVGFALVVICGLGLLTIAEAVEEIVDGR